MRIVSSVYMQVNSGGGGVGGEDLIQMGGCRDIWRVLGYSAGARYVGGTRYVGGDEQFLCRFVAGLLQVHRVRPCS